MTILWQPARPPELDGKFVSDVARQWQRTVKAHRKATGVWPRDVLVKWATVGSVWPRDVLVKWATVGSAQHIVAMEPRP